MAKILTREGIEAVMEQTLLFHRFHTVESLKDIIYSETGNDVSLRDAEITEEEYKEVGDDYQLDGTFGESKFGFAYADFIIYYLKDNQDNLLVTGFVWM